MKTTEEKIEEACGTFVYYKFIKDWRKNFLKRGEFYMGKYSYNLYSYGDCEKAQCSLSYSMDKMVEKVERGELCLTQEEFERVVAIESDMIEQQRQIYVSRAVKKANMDIDAAIETLKSSAQQEISSNKHPV